MLEVYFENSTWVLERALIGDIRCLGFCHWMFLDEVISSDTSYLWNSMPLHILIRNLHYILTFFNPYPLSFQHWTEKMSLYDDLGVETSDSKTEGWSKNFKLLQSQLQVKKAALTQAKVREAKPTCEERGPAGACWGVRATALPLCWICRAPAWPEERLG